MKQDSYIKLECPECMITIEFLKGHQERLCPICLKELIRVKKK